MTDLPEHGIVVMDIAGARAVAACRDAAGAAQLAGLGFEPQADRFVAGIRDEAARRALVEGLLRLDALFGAGRDWSPAELLDFYREQGVIAGPFRVIAWRSPGGYSVTTR